MSSNPDTNVQMTGSLADSLLQVNQISYRMPPQISIASKCTHVVNYSQQSSYNGGNTVIFDIQTGSAFVDPSASYLRFFVKPSDSKHSFGSGSAMNIVQRVVVRTSTGKELSRVENANLLAKMTDVYSNSNDWRDTLGRAQGYWLYAQNGAYSGAIPSTGSLYVIPFKTLAPCFNPIGSKLVPPNIMSGLRIEISLADANDAFCSVEQKTPETLASYTIDGVEAHLKTHILADAFERKIQELSVSGLNYLYKEHFQTIVSPGANSNINFDIKKACSKALTARIMTRLTTYLSTAGRDKMASAPFNYISYQSHIGSDYFPNQPLKIDGGVPSIVNINEAYYYTLYALDKLELWNPPQVKPDRFLGRVLDGVDDEYSDGIVAFNFNKSNVSDLAGYTTSNSRALLVDLQQNSAEDVRLDVFLTFLRLAKIYQSNTIVLD